VTTSAAVAGGSLDDAAAIFLDLRVDQFVAKRLESRQRSFLVRRHQPRMASDVRCENGGQSALGLLRCRQRPPRAGSHTYHPERVARLCPDRLRAFEALMRDEPLGAIEAEVTLRPL
jgi:hypothetical protein